MDLSVYNKLRGMNHKIISSIIIQQINNLKILAKKRLKLLVFYQPKLNHFYTKNYRKILLEILVCLIHSSGINSLRHLILIQVFST